MKKSILILAATTLMAGTIFTGCESPGQKEDAAQAKVEDAKQDLKTAQDEAQEAALNAAIAEEWKTFKRESEVKITDNETRIAELKVKIKKPGNTFDDQYKKKIETLEQKNKDLRTSMDNYVQTDSDWESFKREFNHDMDELGKALTDLTVDNKK